MHKVHRGSSDYNSILFFHTKNLPGKADDLLWKIAKCAGRDGSRNACRGLSRLIHRDGLALPIELKFVEVTCRRRKPKVVDFQIQWPVLSMRSWARYLFENLPRFLLGGHGLHEVRAWKNLHMDFWGRWRAMDDTPELFTMHEGRLGNVIPYYTHGDEGITLRRLPFLVESWQPAISWKGINKTTLSGYLGLYLLFSGVVCVCLSVWAGVARRHNSRLLAFILGPAFVQGFYSLACQVHASAGRKPWHS